MKINSEIILIDFAAFTKTLENFNESHLVSFSFPLQQFDLIILTDQLNDFDDIFLFRNPENRITIIGLNSALELASPETSKFTSISDTFNYWKKNSHTNLNEIEFGTAPIMCCTAKFDPLKTSTLWNDFQSVRFYIPEFFLSFRDNNVKGFFNFKWKKNIEELQSTFSDYLKKIEDIKQNAIDISDPEINSTLASGEKELKEWQISFGKASAILKKGEIEKLVLSRIHAFTINELFKWSDLCNKLSQRFKDCYLFFIKSKKSIFIGSSPEMFLKVTGINAEVESVAGSAPRGERYETDHRLEKVLQTSKKNHQEHLFVTDFISDILIRYSDKVRIIEEKQIKKLDNIQHLITRISAELNSKNKIFELIDSLFPTPAVCGVPKELAMQSIRKIEPHDRGLYSGIIGLIDFSGNCEFTVSIRSALIRENIVTAFAGAGIVKNSNLEEEFLETNLKLNTILSLFNNENKS